MAEDIRNRNFEQEWVFTASRSSGPGGQNVNKVNTRVELRFLIGASEVLTEEEKLLIREKFSARINANDELIITSQSERSQLRNKEKTIEKFFSLLFFALTPKKNRKRTKPTQASILRRLEEKRKRSEKKDRRKPIDG